MEIAIGVAFVGSVALLVIAVYNRLTRKKKFFALCEYWVYSQSEAIPPQDKLMDRMISANPHNRPGKPCIGAREGMLFTDIRLHVALAKKSKNPLVFRPDLFQNDLQIDKEVIERLVQAQSLIKVRYLSEVPLTDTRHLQFLPHMADAMNDLAQGLLVYDVSAEQIFKSEEFTSLLARNNVAESADAHVRIAWAEDMTEGTGRAITKGFRKIGMPDLRTDPVEPDLRTLVTSIMGQIARKVYADRVTQGHFEIQEYGDTFMIELIPENESTVRVSIKRFVTHD